jgi:hypothetical protein
VSESKESEWEEGKKEEIRANLTLNKKDKK